MWKKIAIAGATAAIIGGAGTAALAASGTPTTSPSATPSTSASTSGNGAGAKAAKANGRFVRGEGIAKLRKVTHASWVTEDKGAKTFTTHEAIRGSVTAVSATSIAVKSADNVTQTYVVNADTKIHTQAHKKTGASIADVKTGDPVVVGGTGTSTFTASQIVDAKK
ncbi:hypothetical protein ACSMXN_24295 [Jatrophihabitans sp. DSM 45814]